MTPKTHFFRSTGEAYDACQCDETVITGDVLVVESEQVVGVAHTWPFAVTAQAGHLHQLRPGYLAVDIDPRCGIGAIEAKLIASERGWPVPPQDSGWTPSEPAAPTTPEEDEAFVALGAKLAVRAAEPTYWDEKAKDRWEEFAEENARSRGTEARRG